MPKMTISSLLWKHKQDIYVMLSKFWPLKGWGGGGCELSESVNKRKIHEKILFQIVLSEVLKIYENADVKTDVKQ